MKKNNYILCISFIASIVNVCIMFLSQRNRLVEHDNNTNHTIN